MAEMGVGILIVPQTPGKRFVKNCRLEKFIVRPMRKNPTPMVAGWTFVAKPARKKKLANSSGLLQDSIIEHYEFDKPHLKTRQGTNTMARCSRLKAQVVWK